MDKKFCPFVNGSCRDDCVFKCHKTACPHGLSDCLIAVKLSDINEMQHDVLSDILNSVKK